MRNSLPLVLAGSLVLAACSATPDDASSAIGTSRSQIIGGKKSTAAQDAVVFVLHTDKMTQLGECTGTLIAPNLVLTARHCVSTTTDAPFACKEDGTPAGNFGGGKAGASFPANEFYVFTGNDRPYTAQTGPKHSPAAHGTKVFHDDANVLCGHDVSLILLDKDIEGAAIMPLRLDELPKQGELMTAVGWGVTEVNPTPETRQQRTGIKVLNVGPFAGKGADPAIPANDFGVGEAICTGDSGGPAIAEATGSVMGVVSRGGNGAFPDQTDPSSACTGDTARNYYTATAPFKDLILSAFAEAGHDPWLEGGPDPRLAKFDEACEDGSACRSDLCVAGKCTQSCSASSDCPSGFECGGSGSDKVCRVPAPVAPPPKKSSGGCVAGASGPVGPVVPWMMGMMAALAGLAARRRKKA